jgi:hypothetical protein
MAMMRNLILAMTILAMAGTAPAFARGVHGHRHHHSMHPSVRGLSVPADKAKNADTPTPEKPDPEDAKLDQRIKSICRGC